MDAFWRHMFRLISPQNMSSIIVVVLEDTDFRRLKVSRRQD
jgi:hypothetical protein